MDAYETAFRRSKHLLDFAERCVASGAPKEVQQAAANDALEAAAEVVRIAIAEYANSNDPKARMLTSDTVLKRFGCDIPANATITGIEWPNAVVVPEEATTLVEEYDVASGYKNAELHIKNEKDIF